MTASLPIQFNVGIQPIQSSLTRRRRAIAVLFFVRTARARAVVATGPLDLECVLDGREDRREVAHGRIARLRQHPVQALGRLVDGSGQRLEADAGVDEVTQDPFGRIGLAVDEQGDGLVQQSLCEGRVVLCAGHAGVAILPAWLGRYGGRCIFTVRAS